MAHSTPLPAAIMSSSLSRLFQYARQYRRDAYLASLYSACNKFFDILPEVLIGVAVDVVDRKSVV